MEKINGKKIAGGIAIGPLKRYRKERKPVLRERAKDVRAELARYEAAKERAIGQLNALREQAVREAGEKNAQIFGVHAMMLEDADYNDFVSGVIRTQEANAEYAVAEAGEHFAKMFAGMEDAYFRARSADVKDISDRVVTILGGGTIDADIGGEPVILAAEDLAPSETVQMDKSCLLAFVTHFGSAHSHTAILARTLGIPALTGIVFRAEWEGRLAVVDGQQGVLIIDPDEETLARYRQKKEKEAKERGMLEALRGKESITPDGRRIKLYANIGNVSDLPLALKNDAEGIGLFRSEFLYLEQDRFPTEEEQFAAYRQAAEAMAGKKVIIRTLDIGADKKADYFGLDPEENPAMGCRAIRVCLTRPDIFKTQLRAIYRASAFGRIAIMYPMIISLSEVQRAKAVAAEVRGELRQEGIAIGTVEQGIMIETPAAAVISDLLAPEVDFFSLGTNDLTQYTLAIDRQNDALGEFYDAHHPAILRLIETVVKNAHAAGIWVGICGELGADRELTRYFLRIGVDELSVSPGLILPLRGEIRRMKVEGEE